MATSVKRILVLEDAEKRVMWLRGLFKGREDIEIDWCETVQDFRKRMNLPHDVVIFDHDLGESENGRDAACAYILRDSFSTPISALVWSVNAWGASDIARALASVGIPVSSIPFLKRNESRLADALILWTHPAGVDGEEDGARARARAGVDGEVA